jgi:hypothetical protein
MRLRVAVLSAFALLVLSSVAEAGPILNGIRERRQERRQSAVVQSAPQCTYCSPCTCPPANCPGKCPLFQQPTVFGLTLPSAQSPCANGQCPIKPRR